MRLTPQAIERIRKEWSLLHPFETVKVDNQGVVTVEKSKKRGPETSLEKAMREAREGKKITPAPGVIEREVG